ncbi:GNAT family N-acetyltransferase [Hydrogenovibrio kuenenii]|uniref:GNAT family N-acetyltransferase n=1 Tax=Hydrogenovibrio kuenenii TaxID=63658 RepID=UPI0004B9A3EB|nr:GNAT family N-acetyltransferase [Hydrogenovibrio kuenenii]
MTEAIQIRSAELSDINALNRLLASLFQQEDEFTPSLESQTQGLTEILHHPEMGQILVSCETSTPEQNIIGMVSLLFTISTALGGKVALLEDMIVSENYRKQGIGSALIQSAIDEAKRHDCKRITLLTDNHNTAAQVFYEKHGFQASPMRPYRLLLE